MKRYLWIGDGIAWERGPCGSFRCYAGEAAAVMALVLRHSR